MIDRSGTDTSQASPLSRVRQFESLAAAVRSSRPLEAVIDLVIEQIAEVVSIDSAAVWLHDADSDLWYIGGGRGLTRRAARVQFKGGEAIHNSIGEEGEIVANPSSAGFRRLYPEHHLVKGALYAPMKIAGRRVGLIALYRHTEDPFTEDDLRFVRTVGSHLGMAISFAALEARAERLAVLEERSRLGADLHDGILQILSSVRVYVEELRSSLEGIDDRLDDDAAGSIRLTLSQLEACIDTGSEEIAASVEHLRSPDSVVDVCRQLEVTRDRLEAGGIKTSLTCQIDDIAPDASDALAWIAREAASNILQHSRAQHVAISARSRGDGEVELTISDDGVGAIAEPDPGADEFDDRPLGLGIMRERARHLGGTVEISSGAVGTTVTARVPAAPLESADR